MVKIKTHIRILKKSNLECFGHMRRDDTIANKDALLEWESEENWILHRRMRHCIAQGEIYQDKYWIDR